MIIFDLDGTLANCEHRRHFVDPSHRDDCYFHDPATLTQSKGWYYKDEFLMSDPPRAKKFIPDWKAFHEACDKDDPIKASVEILHRLFECEQEIHIWSGRCESVREKTEEWLHKHCIHYNDLKMRPIEDYTPDDELKEIWLDEAICSRPVGWSHMKHPIRFVFDDRPKVIRMWRRRGIFVFDVNQTGKEF